MANMDLSNYAGLQAAVAAFLNRDDLSEQIPGFIQLAEAEIGRRVRRRKVRATVTFATDAYTLPATCAEIQSVRLVTSATYADKPIALGTKEQLDETQARYAGTKSRPIRGAVVGTELLLAPAPDQSYSAEIVYYEKLVPLSNSAATNALLTEAPDLYLKGALIQAAQYLEHDERIPTWRDGFESAIDQLNTSRKNEEFSGSLRPMRLPRVFG